MKIPKKLKSQGIIWTVKFDKSLDPLAVTDYYEQVITVKAGIKKEMQEAAFLHEIFHTINTTIDHVLLDSLALQYYQVLKENKLLK